MEEENNIVKNEDEDHVETLLIKPIIKEERDLPEYIDINAISLPNSKSDIVEQFFKCTECSIKYRKLEYLEIHTAVHDPSLSCRFCCQLFSCGKQYRLHIHRHVRNKMSSDKKVCYKCSFCPKTFNAKKKYTIHLRVHTNERPHRCTICGEGFKQRGALKDHKVTHTKERNYVCEICNGAYTTSSSLKRHKKRIHDRGRTMSCNMCFAEFQNMADYKDHRTTIHPTVNFKRACPVCSTVFSSKRAYREHKLLHIERVPMDRFVFKNFQCTLCGKEMDSLKVFFAHKRRHLGYTNEDMKYAMQSKSFCCKLCSFKCKNREFLLGHMDVHGNKSVKCDLCQDQHTYSGLKWHKRKIHQMLDCPVCPKIVKRSEMQHHYRKYHRGLNRRHQCILCGKKCVTQRLLRHHHRLKHRVNSAGVKKFKCGTCGKRFVTQRVMVTHKEKVHGIKVKFKCCHCGLIYQTLKEIYVHRLRHRDIDRSGFSTKTIVKAPKKFRCKMCKKIFQCLENYRGHVAMRTCVNFFRKRVKSETNEKI